MQKKEKLFRNDFKKLLNIHAYIYKKEKEYMNNIKFYNKNSLANFSIKTMLDNLCLFLPLDDFSDLRMSCHFIIQFLKFDSSMKYYR